MIRGDMYVSAGSAVVELREWNTQYVVVLKYGGEEEIITRSFFETWYKNVYAVTI